MGSFSFFAFAIAGLQALELRRNRLEISAQMNTLAALRGMAREGSASLAEIEVTDRTYKTFDTTRVREIIRGRGTLL